MFLIFFSAALSRTLRLADELSVLPAVIIVGASVMAVGIAIDATIAFSIAEAVDDIEPASVQTLQALWDNDFIPIAMGVITLPASLRPRDRADRRAAEMARLGGDRARRARLHAGRVRRLPRRRVWIAIVSVMLTMRARAGAPPAAAPPPAPATPA